MSAFRKVLIATALVTTGLGVAFFLGHPVVAPVLQSSEKPVPRPTMAVPQIAKPAAENATAKVKLLPEPAAARPDDAAVPEPPALLSSLAPIAGASLRSAPISDLADIPSAAPKPSSSTATLRVAEEATLTAKLRNEAPRPIGNEPRSPATIRRMPPVNTAESPPSTTLIGQISDEEDDVANNASNHSGMNSKTAVDWPAAQSLPPNHELVRTGYNSDPNTTPAANTAYSAPMRTADSRHFALPPWPLANEDQSPRTHLIEDGDSLEKLASQYLDDPLRSREIFELNREVLSSPDLLPIGAELKIPARNSGNAWGRQSRRLDEPSPATIRQAASGNLVPIRHPFSNAPENEPAPRAQLAAPVAIE